MYYDPYDDYAKDQQMNDFIEKEMYRLKDEALRKLSFCLVHYLNDHSIIFAYAYRDGIESAVNLARKLDLSTMDFLAIDEDFQAFRSVYIVEIEKFNDFDLEEL